MIDSKDGSVSGWCYVHHTLEDLDKYNGNISKLDGMPIKHHIHGDGYLLVASLDEGYNQSILALFPPLVQGVQIIWDLPYYLGFINLTELGF